MVVNISITHLLQRKSGETYHKIFKILKIHICDYVNLGLLRQENADLWWIPITNARWSLSLFWMKNTYAWFYILGQFKKHTREGHSVVHHIVDKLRSANLLNISAHTYICYAAYYMQVTSNIRWWWCLLS